MQAAEKSLKERTNENDAHANLTNDTSSPEYSQVH